MVANALVAGTTGNGLVSFFTNQSGDGSFNINARELVDYFIQGGSGGIHGQSAANAGIDATPQAVMMRNIKANWPQMLAAGIFIPAGFTIAKKLLGKSILRPARKMIKATGLEVTV